MENSSRSSCSASRSCSYLRHFRRPPWLRWDLCSCVAGKEIVLSHFFYWFKTGFPACVLLNIKYMSTPVVGSSVCPRSGWIHINILIAFFRWRCWDWILRAVIIIMYMYTGWKCQKVVLFIAFIQQTILSSVRAQDPEFTGDGYVSLCIIYAVFAIGSWVAPSVVAVIGAKWGMVLSAIVYLAFIAQFIAPSTSLLYITSALLGGAASVLWCCQGQSQWIMSIIKHYRK